LPLGPGPQEEVAGAGEGRGRRKRWRGRWPGQVAHGQLRGQVVRRRGRVSLATGRLSATTTWPLASTGHPVFLCLLLSRHSAALRNRCSSREQRLDVSTLRTASSRACRLPTSTTSRLPRVTAVYRRLRWSSLKCLVCSGITTAGYSDPCPLWI